ncbi:MAG: divergent polysaccharide deacetylase family protein [bacterium]|nr:divergent polysaccharide deacetylase family protein [bacterium]
MNNYLQKILGLFSKIKFSYLQKILGPFSKIKFSIPSAFLKNPFLQALLSYKKSLVILGMLALSSGSYILAWSEKGASFSLPLLEYALHHASESTPQKSALQGDAWNPDEQDAPLLTTSAGPTKHQEHTLSLDLPEELLTRTSGVVCVIVTGLGVDAPLTQEVLSTLPPEINLSFSTSSPKGSQWFEKAANYGHETLLEIPMEPIDYPHSDPGPGTLLTALPIEENLRRLESHLQQEQGYQGVLNAMGGRFLAIEDVLAPPLRRLKEKALIFVDTAEIYLSKSEEIAKKVGTALLQCTININPLAYEENALDAFHRVDSEIGYSDITILSVRATPKTLKALSQWVEQLKNNKDLILLPLTQTFAFKKHLEKGLEESEKKEKA